MGSSNTNTPNPDQTSSGVGKGIFSSPANPTSDTSTTSAIPTTSSASSAPTAGIFSSQANPTSSTLGQDTLNAVSVTPETPATNSPISSGSITSSSASSGASNPAPSTNTITSAGITSSATASRNFFGSRVKAASRFGSATSSVPPASSASAVASRFEAINSTTPIRKKPFFTKGKIAIITTLVLATVAVIVVNLVTTNSKKSVQQTQQSQESATLNSSIAQKIKNGDSANTGLSDIMIFSRDFIENKLITEKIDTSGKRVSLQDTENSFPTVTTFNFNSACTRFLFQKDNQNRVDCMSIVDQMNFLPSKEIFMDHLRESILEEFSGIEAISRKIKLDKITYYNGRTFIEMSLVDDDLAASIVFEYNGAKLSYVTGYQGREIVQIIAMEKNS